MERRTFCKVAAGVVGAATLPGAVRASPAGSVSGLPPAHVADLRSALRGQLLLPKDPAYDAARKLWNGAFDRRPALIARCADASDVTRAIDFARAQTLPLAVRAGGHSFPGHSSCDGGLVIDLTSMRAVQLDRNARTIRVGSGALLGELRSEEHTSELQSQ